MYLIIKVKIKYLKYSNLRFEYSGLNIFGSIIKESKEKSGLGRSFFIAKFY